MTKFEVGMEVLVWPRSHSDPHTFGTVAKVSPAGKLVTLADGRKFSGDGNEIGGRLWSREYIEPLTDKVRAGIVAEQAAAVEQAQFKKLFAQITHEIQYLPAADLQRVADLITELRAAQSAPR